MITLNEIKKRSSLAFSDIVSKDEKITDSVSPKLVLEHNLLSILKKPNNIIPSISSDEFDSLASIFLSASACEKIKEPKKVPYDEIKKASVIEENKIVIQQNKDNSFLESELFDAQMLASKLDFKDQRIEKKLLKGFKIVTTHPIKHNETPGMIDYALNMKKDTSIKHGISSVNLESKAEVLTVSGNAADLGSRYIFLLRFILDGNTTSIIEMLASEDQLVISFFEKVGMRHDFIEELVHIAKNLVENSFPDDVVGNQVFWKTGDEYTLISPIPSVQMIVEQRNIQQKQKSDGRLRFSQSSKAVGGANGQNLSQINSQIPNQIFYSDLSFLNSRPDKVNKLISFDNVPQLTSKIRFLSKKEKSLLSNPLHSSAIRTHNGVVSSLVFKLLSNLVQARGLDVEFSSKTFTCKEDKMFLMGIKCNDDFLVFEEYVYENLLKDLNNHSIEVVSDNIKVREIKRVISKIVRGI